MLFVSSFNLEIFYFINLQVTKINMQGEMKKAHLKRRDILR